MTEEQIKTLKRKHNILMREGQELQATLLNKAEELLQMRKDIQDEEGDEYDGIPLIFGCGYWVDEDETGEW